MATNIIYIHDLPFHPRQQLCRILDADRRWEELGGQYMKYDVTTLTLIGQAVQRDKSPTSELLNKYSERNGTINRLFIMLAKMDHQRAMSVLQPYVEKKYHCLLQNESTFSTAFLNSTKKGDIPVSSLLSSSSNQSHWSHSSIHKQTSDTCSFSHKVKETSCSSNSKFDNEFANMNENFNSVSLQSKLKSLNMLQNPSPAIPSKKSPDLSNFKKNSASKVESVSDNCVSEKIKNARKLSVQEALLNGKQIKQPAHLNCAVSLNSQEDALPDIMHIPYTDICKATNNFDKNRVLGRGGFGTVYKGEWKGTSVAIKRLTPRESSDGPSQQLVSIKQSLNELNILRCCRFDHILPLYAVSLDGANPCLIYQLMVNGSLEDRLLCKNKTPPLTWSQRSHIAECTTKGLNYLHTTPGKPLIHGDIKSANILLDSNMDAKIGDFGLTREGPGCDDTHVKVSSVHGTECYLPPEYLRQRHLSPQVDIYSYGIVLLEIATGLRPFDSKREEAKRLVDYVKICDGSGRLDSLRDTKAGEENMIWFRELIQIGQRCSSSEKKKRPPMQDVLGQFEKIREEMTMIDRIRRLSNDKGNSSKPLKVISELTPLELQLYYDYQKDGQSGVSLNNKLLSTSPRNVNPNEVVLPVPDLAKDNSSNCTKQSNASSEGLEKRDSYVSSECSENESEAITSPDQTNQSSSEDRNSSDAKAPIPLLTVLRLQISEFGDGSEDSLSQCEKSTCNVSSDISS